MGFSPKMVAKERNFCRVWIGRSKLNFSKQNGRCYDVFNNLNLNLNKKDFLQSPYFLSNSIFMLLNNSFDIKFQHVSSKQHQRLILNHMSVQKIQYFFCFSDYLCFCIPDIFLFFTLLLQQQALSFLSNMYILITSINQ